MTALRGMGLEFECGEDSLTVRHFSVTERVSGAFELAVLAMSRLPNIDLEPFVGKGAGLSVRGVVSRVWSGVCSHAGQVHAEEHGLSAYMFHIVPTLWLLTQRRGNRIFQHLSIPDIAKKLLAEWGIENELKIDETAYPKLEYCLQYNETDFTFLSRLLERAGISYYFVDKDGGKKVTTELVLADRPQDNPSRGHIDFVDNPNQASRKEFLTNVVLGHRVAHGPFNFRDFDFRRPDLQFVGESPPTPGPEGQYEVYTYVPGGVLADVTSPPDKTPIADEHSSARHDEKFAPTRALISQIAQRAGKRQVHFRTNVLELYPGVVFQMDLHPSKELQMDKKLLVVGSRAEGDASGEWTMIAEAVPAEDPYHPPQARPPSRVPGLQSAVVVGPKGEEIHADEFGRVHVHFHWDREGVFDENATCWLRVSQGWAGSVFGMEIVPRIGHEVLVDFYDGDPDQPVIVGRVYSGVALPPYVLPKGKTQSTWKSDTTPHTDKAWNEIMFEDKATEELLFVQAQRDLRKLVKRNETERTYRDRRRVVGESQLSVIAGLDAYQVGEERLVKIVTANDLKILEMGDPDTSPTDTWIEVKSKKITLTNGNAKVVLDGPKIEIEADDGIRFTSEGELIIEGGPNVYLNDSSAADPSVSADKKVKDPVAKPAGRVLASILKLFQKTRPPEKRKVPEFQVTGIVPVNSAVGGFAAAVAGLFKKKPAPPAPMPYQFGLADPKNMEEFCKDMKAVQQAWPGMTVAQREGAIADALNKQLAKSGVPPIDVVAHDYGPGDPYTNGTFGFTKWEVEIKKATMEKATLSDAEAAELADTTYHESRHCEQWFQMVRTQAAANPGLDRNALAKSNWVSKDVVREAMKKPMDPAAPEAAFGKAMNDSVYGPGAAHRNKVLTDLGDPDPAVAGPAYPQYKALPEEADAWNVGGATQKMFGEVKP
jgi:type VI secretion system secreted protein VgrG